MISQGTVCSGACGTNVLILQTTLYAKLACLSVVNNSSVGIVFCDLVSACDYVIRQLVLRCDGDEDEIAKLMLTLNMPMIPCKDLQN